MKGIEEQIMALSEEQRNIDKQCLEYEHQYSRQLQAYMLKK